MSSLVPQVGLRTLHALALGACAAKLGSPLFVEPVLAGLEVGHAQESHPGRL